MKFPKPNIMVKQAQAQAQLGMHEITVHKFLAEPYWAVSGPVEVDPELAKMAEESTLQMHKKMQGNIFLCQDMCRWLYNGS